MKDYLKIDSFSLSVLFTVCMYLGKTMCLVNLWSPFRRRYLILLPAKHYFQTPSQSLEAQTSCYAHAQKDVAL